MGKNIWGENVLDSKDPNDPYSVISRGGLVDNVISEQGGGEKEDGEIKLAGHLFEEDGVYIGQWGKKTNNCFSVKKGAWRIEEEKGKRTIYYEKQNLTKLTDLDFSAIELDTVLKLASIFFDEGGGSTEFHEDTIVAIACATSNYLKARNNYFSVVTYKNLANKEEIPNYAYGKNTWIKKIDNTNIKNVTSIKAVLHILLNKGDTSNGAVRWDGEDLAWKGNNHDKPKNEGIDFKEIHFNFLNRFTRKRE